MSLVSRLDDDCAELSKLSCIVQLECEKLPVQCSLLNYIHSAVAVCAAKDASQPEQNKLCPCADSEALDILAQFDSLYEQRVAQVDADPLATDAQRNELKLKIMTDWVKDLGEQNSMLVQTVNDLEQAAVRRVKLLESKLQMTSNLISHNMLQSDKSEDDLNALSNRICQLISSQDDMQIKINHLQCDIKNLLKLIKQGRTQNNWNLDGIEFYEIQPSDLPEADECTCDQGNPSLKKNFTTSQAGDHEKIHIRYQNELEDRIAHLLEQINLKDETVNKYLCEIENLRDSLQTYHDLEEQFQNSLLNKECIAGEGKAERSTITNTKVEFEKLCEKLYNTEEKLESLEHEHECGMKNLQMCLEEKSRENEGLTNRIACLEKELLESREALTNEVAQKHDSIVALKKNVEYLEEQLQQSTIVLKMREECNRQLRHDLRVVSEKVPTANRRVRISSEPDNKLMYKELEGKLHKAVIQLEEWKNLALKKDDEINMLKSQLLVKPNVTGLRKDGDSMQTILPEHQNEILIYLMHLAASMAEDNETILSLKTEYESVLKNLELTKISYEKRVALVNEKLHDIEECLQNYRSEVIEQFQIRNQDRATEIISVMENEVTSLKILLESRCEMCLKEDSVPELGVIILQVSRGVQTLSKLYETNNQMKSLINELLKNKSVVENSTDKQMEHKAVLEAIWRQFRLMEEFRICTVEVQAATEDLREEISEVISNLNARHCKYIELTNTVNQVQDYLTSTRENISLVINDLELQDLQRNRISERISNNRVRLKDMKNEFNKTQSELSRCLNNVFTNVQNNCLLEYAEVHKCNILFTSITEEMEEIASNLQTFQKQGCTLSTLVEFKKQLIVLEHNVKELKKKSDHVMLETEAAQKSFLEKSKRLEKYECEIDNCHTKMQDALESIVTIRDQMNEFGQIQESEDCFQSTNDVIEMKNELRSLRRECDEWKMKASEEIFSNKPSQEMLRLQNEVTDLQNQIKLLQCELRSHGDANMSLRKNIEGLENEIRSAHSKSEELRKHYSDELKKELLEIENSIKSQQNGESMKYDFHGSNENVPQLFKLLQDTIQAIQAGLQELSDSLGNSGSVELVRSAENCEIEPPTTNVLKRCIQKIQCCAFEIEKIKNALYSKDKLMENMDEIIRIQKDSLCISQSEVTELHKTLHEKIAVQEETILRCEKEKNDLNKQVELQVQTIRHLQDAVVEAKKTIDQLSNKAKSDTTSKNQTIHSLNLYLNETLSQYIDCFGEASEQGTILELQRDAIFQLHETIEALGFSEFLNSFLLHLIYSIIISKYKAQLESQSKLLHDSKSKVDDLLSAKKCLENQCSILQDQCQNAKNENENLRFSIEKSCERTLCEKQEKIDILMDENDDLKRQLQVFRLDFDLIEEEMKKLGVKSPFAQNFPRELEKLRCENEKLAKTIDCFEKAVDEMRRTEICLRKKVQDLKTEKDFIVGKFKEKLRFLQIELVDKSKKMNCLSSQSEGHEKLIQQQSQLINELNDRLNQSDCRMKSCIFELENRKKTMCMLEQHLARLKNEIIILKEQNQILKSERNVDQFQLKTTQTQLTEIQKSYEKVSQDLSKSREYLIKSASKRSAEVSDQRPHVGDGDCHCHRARKNDRNDDEIVKKVSEELEKMRVERDTKCMELTEIQSKFNALTSKYENSEKNSQRQKDELMLLEKKLATCQQKFQNCTDKNDELVRQNRILEDNYNKCMEELNDIVLQVEDMQSSLVELRRESDVKSQSLDCVSLELTKMKVSRSELFEETKYVLDWVRRWMRQQRQTISFLQEKLRDKKQIVLRVKSEKRNYWCELKKLRRRNAFLSRRLKRSRKPTLKQTIALLNYCSTPRYKNRKYLDKDRPLHGSYPMQSLDRVSNAVYSHFKRECKEDFSSAIDKITTEGDDSWFPFLEHLTREIPKTSQISQDTLIKGKNLDDSTDNGYQTSSSK
ncbi:hypothetical protein QAD02_017084 [Eretmocerus hayati]|uniref:Uncharacterized protein n=1 Tax=Eretmocerus hayati TaxID=131215 RepID=A0ACC2PFS8_9HYME|nr:hypothetical protein QAD02_017084 [Eretmocerus hayati]